MFGGYAYSLLYGYHYVCILDGMETNDYIWSRVLNVCFGCNLT